MQAKTFTALALALAASAQAATPAPATKPSLADVIKAAPAQDWRPLDPENTLYLELPQGRVVIELAPSFAPNHVANIRAMVREHALDNIAIIRSQDNYVVQWSDPDEEHPRPLKNAKQKLKAEFEVPLKNDTQFTALPDKDGYAPVIGFSNGFPAARDPKAGTTWLTHCYRAVGVARDMDINSGSGSSLYAIIGQATRHLDRNITTVGRVVWGMELMSAVPRGPGPMGFYDKPEMRIPIKTTTLAADVPAEQRTKLEVMRTESPSFKAAVESQRNRPGPFFIRPAGHVDLCNVTVPIREIK